MRRVVATIVALALAAPSLAAQSLPPVPPLALDEPDVGKAISPMRLGQRAPFTGVLLSPAAAADMTVQLQQEPARTKVQVDRAVGLQRATDVQEYDILKANSSADAAVASAHLDAQLKANDLLAKRVALLEKESSSPAMWFGLGFAGGVVVTVAVVFASVHAAK